MTRFSFIALCGKYMIDVDLALENESIREALTKRDDKAVESLLKTEF